MSKRFSKMYYAKLLLQLTIIFLLMSGFSQNKENFHSHKSNTNGTKKLVTTKHTNSNERSMDPETLETITMRIKRNNQDDNTTCVELAESENITKELHSIDECEEVGTVAKTNRRNEINTTIESTSILKLNDTTESIETEESNSTESTTPSINATTQEISRSRTKKSRSEILKELQSHTKTVDIKDHPYMVSIQREMIHSCCGSIVSKRWVLTAAHCLTLPGSAVLLVDIIKVVVVAGQSHLGLGKMQLRRVRDLYIHSSFSKKLLNNNIGMVQLFQPFDLNDYVNVVHLSSSISKPYKFFGDCYVVSWTVYRKDFLSFDKLRAEDKNVRKLFRVPELQMVHLPTITIEECFDRIKAKEFLDQRNHICTEYGTYKNVACVTDAGSPLICGDRQYGIFSWGIGCDDYDYPGVFTNVAPFRKWISSIGTDPFEYISRNKEPPRFNFVYSTFIFIEIYYIILKSIQ